jgi:hypothetical protein
MNDDKWVDAIEERMKMDGKQNHIDVLKTEIEVLASRLEPHDTGHLHTTIYTLKHRIEELQKELLKIFVNTTLLDQKFLASGELQMKIRFFIRVFNLLT